MNLIEWLHGVCWTVIILMGLYFAYNYILLVEVLEKYYFG